MNPKAHVPIVLVLAGGGTQGLAHAGVLRAVENYGFRPSAVMGVSMGAVEFSPKRVCIAAGSRAVRASLNDLQALLQKA